MVSDGISAINELSWLTRANGLVWATAMLLAHALPIEGAVAKLSGISWRVTLLLRMGCVFIWQPTPSSSSLLDWGVTQLTMLVSIFFIITALMLLLRLRLLRWCSIEKLSKHCCLPF
jgi:hypothetical protein